MLFPITIFVYPLFGSWRAECQNCGAYGNSGSSRYKSKIAEALDNLSKNQNIFSDKSKNCPHYSGSYAPRVGTYIKAEHVNHIKDLKTVVVNTQTLEPSQILIDKYHISVIKSPIFSVLNPLPATSNNYPILKPKPKTIDNTSYNLKMKKISSKQMMERVVFIGLWILFIFSLALGIAIKAGHCSSMIDKIEQEQPSPYLEP